MLVKYFYMKETVALLQHIGILFCKHNYLNRITHGMVATKVISWNE